MNFCVTDGESVIAIRYIASRHLEAASLVHISRQPPRRTELILWNSGSLQVLLSANILQVAIIR